MTLPDELARLADSGPRPSFDPTLWERGRGLRRRDRLVTSAVVLALVVILGGLATLVVGPPRAVGPASETVPGGAIPSVIRDVPDGLTGPLETDLAIGRGSVAVNSLSGVAIVIGATDGRHHLLDLPERPTESPLALSPDGYLLAWRSQARIHVADLRSGQVTAFTPAGSPSEVKDLHWETDSEHLIWQGRGAIPTQGVIDVVTRTQREEPQGGASWRGIPSPDQTLVALSRTRDAHYVRFEQDGSCCLFRTLPTDVYPEGAAVTPLGWAADDLVVAQVFADPGGYVEGQHLVLFTSPDRPKSAWTYRILVRNLPPATEVSIAVDLIPDLDGTSSQQLTHDFGEPDWPMSQSTLSLLIGLGVAAAVGVLLGLRWWLRRSRL